MWLLAAAWVLGWQPAVAQLSAEQQRLLQQLPAEERSALLQGRGEPQRTAERPEFPELVRQDAAREAERQREADAARRIGPGDTLVIEFRPDEARLERLDSARAALNRVAAGRLDAGNPYRLDELGRVTLPGIGSIALAGLTTGEAQVRLAAEQDLRGITIGITRLPLDRLGVEGLRPFGYELFEGVPTTFAPVSDIPVPADYRLGPGDELRVQLFGNRNAEYRLPVSRDLAINFPELGPVSVGGLTFDEVRAELERRVGEQFIGTRLSVALGELRSIRIFVLGDVRRPGSYTVSSLATMTNALFYSGGVDPRGSLRRVELKRNGEVVTTLDLYDLLLDGNTRGDRRLQPGDVIFVPPVGARVGISGEVRRPAIYELRGEATTAELLRFAGGLMPRGDSRAVRLERLDDAGARIVEELDMSSGPGRMVRLRDGDLLRIPSAVQQLEGAVVLEGNVFRPGEYQWRSGLRLTDLLGSSRELKPRSDLRYILIRREVVPNAEILLFSIDLQEAWNTPADPQRNPPLLPRDTVYVFDRDVGREHITRRLREELALQTGPERPLPVVRIEGRVQAPGEYPLEPGMAVSDLLRAGGGLQDSAFLRDVELVRYQVVDGEARIAEVRRLDLAAILAGGQPDVLLQPSDFLNVRQVSGWRAQEVIELGGEVRFPGVYPFSPGETLASVIERAGGLTDLADPRAAIFTRQTLRDREREQLDVLAARIESDLAALALSDPDNIEAVSTGQTLLRQLRTAQPTGRLVIDLEGLLAQRRGTDVKLRAGDSLFIPTTSQEVMVLGEVQFSTAHLHQSGLSREDYINRSGGLTAKADSRRIYVVRASGEVVAGNSRAMARRGGIEPGDTIVVPLDTERVRPLVLWTGATQIIYQLAIAAAAVNSF
ncbi:MAG: SLBB domain-containing protein [Chromatiales bacterium]|nr:SLBB domain-containing protein [Chromatiales bacterium]